MVFQAIWWILFSCPLVCSADWRHAHLPGHEKSGWLSLPPALVAEIDLAFCSAWLVNYYIHATRNKTKCELQRFCGCCLHMYVQLQWCMVRGWFYIHVLQRLMIRLWAFALIYSSRLFTQWDSQPTDFSLPLATHCTLACTCAYACVRVWF